MTQVRFVPPDASGGNVMAAMGEATAVAGFSKALSQTEREQARKRRLGRQLLIWPLLTFMVIWGWWVPWFGYLVPASWG